MFTNVNILSFSISLEVGNFLIKIHGNRPMVSEAVRRVINKVAGNKKVGAQQVLANLLKINRCVVNGWLNGTRNVPLNHALHMEVLVESLVKAEELAPYSKMEILLYRKLLFKQYAMEKSRTH